MKKLSKWKKALAMILVVIMTLAMAGCSNVIDKDGNGSDGKGGGKSGGKKIAADPMLAKQYVFRYEDIKLGGTSEEDSYDPSILTSRVNGNTIEIMTQTYTWSSGYNGQVLSLTTMNLDGTNAKTIKLENASIPDSSDTAIQRTSDDSYYYESTYYNSCVLTDDAIYAVANSWKEAYDDEGNYLSSNSTGICGWNKQDGSFLFATPIDMTKFQNEDTYSYINRMINLGDGKIGLLMSGDQTGILNIDKDGKMSELKKFASDNGRLSQDPAFAERKDGTFYVAYYNDDWTKQYITTFNPKDGSFGQEYEVPQQARYNGFYNFCEGLTTDVMFSGSEGVFGFNLGDKEVTKIMDFVNSDLASYSLQNMIPLDSTHFLGSYYDNATYSQSMALFSYVRPEDIQDKKVLVYAGIYIDSEMKARIINYNKKNTEYRITISDYSQYNTEEDYSAAITKLNNDMIAGNIPDILQLDSSMPIQSYVSKKALANIDELIKNDPELSKLEYMQNIFDAYRVDGVLYSVVPSFTLHTWIAKKSLAGDRTSWSMSDVKQAANKLVGDKAIFGMGMTRDSFIYDIMNYCGSDFVDMSTGKVNFSNQNFIDLLEYARTLPQEEGIDYSDEEYWTNYWQNYQSQYRENRALMMECYVSNLSDLKYNVNGSMGEDVSYVGFPTDSGTGAYVDSYRSFAISANSEYQDGAWNFVRQFLTEDYQTNKDNEYGYMGGIPVLKKLVKEQAVKLTEKPYWTDENGNRIEYEDTYYMNGEEIPILPFTKEQAEKVYNYVCNIRNTSYSDEDINKIVDEEVQSFFSGSKSAADVANMIQNRVNLYVQENSN